MVSRQALKTALTALVLTPLLVAGTSGGCGCGEGPNLPETNAVSGCGSSDGSYKEPNPRDLTTSKQKMAKELGGRTGASGRRPASGRRSRRAYPRAKLLTPASG